MKLWMETVTHSGEVRRTELQVDIYLKGVDKTEVVLRIQFDAGRWIDIGVDERALHDAILSAPNHPIVKKIDDDLGDLLG